MGESLVILILEDHPPKEYNINIKDWEEIMENILKKSGFICDMDGVIYHGNKILDGVKEFVGTLKDFNGNVILEVDGNIHEFSLKEISPENFGGRTVVRILRSVLSNGLKANLSHEISFPTLYVGRFDR